MKSKIMILCSGFGLGFYIPGLLLKNALLKEGIEAEVDVFENYLLKEKEQKVDESRREYHNNFLTAQLAARLPIDIRESLDEQKISNLLEKWKKENINYFISLSGHWGYILKQYMERSKNKIKVENLHIDCDNAPSWLGLNRYFPENKKYFSELNMYDIKQKSILYRIPVESDENFFPYRERENRFVVHGGGWGMGTYRTAQKELSIHNFKMDIVVYQLEEEFEKCNNARYYVNDPEWRAWHYWGEGYIFPPYGQIGEEGVISYKHTKKWHWLFGYIRNAKGIISKPGAGTLIDSIESGTPLIMLEAFGKHERKNFQLWESLGLGVSYQRWKDSDFDMEMLKECHSKLVDAKLNTKSICEHIKNKIESEQDV